MPRRHGRKHRRWGRGGTRGRTGEDDVLDWLRTSDARAVAARFVQRRGLTGGKALVDDVLGEAALATLVRMRSVVPLAVEAPGGYGTAVIRSVVRRLIRGRDVAIDDVAEFEDPGQESVDPLAGDEVRIVFEQMPTSAPSLASASLSYLVDLMSPGPVPDGVPSPKAGANANQARCWPALWFAGERDLFPDGDGDPNRRTRARRIDKVLARVELGFARRRLELGADHDE